MREDEKLLVKNWKLWNPRCAYHRFYLLAFTCCIPFGGHFVKNSMSSLEPMLLRDESFVMDNVMYGGLVSAVSLPNIIMPFLGGKQLDKQGHFGLMRFLVCMVIGQVVFTIAMCMKSYRFACVGRVLFGIGEGSVVVGSRVIVSHWFEKHELSFAMGATVAVANVSKMMAKATVAPVAIYFGGYIYAFWYSTVVCVFSLLMGCVVLKSTGKLRKIISKKIQHGEVVSPEFEWMERPIRNKLSRNTSRVSLPKWTELKQMFWVMAVLHMVFILVFHLFQNVSSSYLYQRYGYSVVRAGYVSSLSHACTIVAPLIGLGIDKIGGRVRIMLLASILSITAYGLLIFTDITPVVSMLLISVCLSFTPMVLMASIPLVVSSAGFGLAFGVIEVLDAFGSASGNLLIGYLRDRTGNYDADMYFLLGLATVSLVLTCCMCVLDSRTDRVLEKPTRFRHRFSSLDIEDPCGDLGSTLYGTSSGDSSPTESRFLC